MTLLVVGTWLPRRRAQPLCLCQMYATTALCAVQKVSGKAPVMNAIAAVIATCLKCVHVRNVPEHLQGTFNIQFNTVSIIGKGAEN